jgi:hypothetical protein
METYAWQRRIMRREPIEEVRIDERNRLLLRASATTFDKIYRAATGVEWDAAALALASPVPREFSHSRWFEQIVSSVAGEYGIELTLGPDTNWTAVPADARREIETFVRSDWLDRFDSRGRERDRASWLHHELQQALSQAAPHWEAGDYAGYAEILASVRNRLSPAQLKRLAIAEKRSRTG